MKQRFKTRVFVQQCHKNLCSDLQAALLECIFEFSVLVLAGIELIL